jgi:hypothetical protein
MEIQVGNPGTDPVTVQRAKLVSTRLAAFPVWDEPVEVAPGAAVDLKVQLPPALCGRAASDEVEITVDGRQWTVPAQDTLGQLARYQAAQCFRQEVERVATLRVIGLVGDALQLEARGDVTLGEFGTTTLFRPRDPLSLTRGRQVRLTPNRCDAHALADDKQGTYFPLTVTLPDGRSGQYVLGVDARTRSRLYDFYARTCGL